MIARYNLRDGIGKFLCEKRSNAWGGNRGKVVLWIAVTAVSKTKLCLFSSSNTFRIQWKLYKISILLPLHNFRSYTTQCLLQIISDSLGASECLGWVKCWEKIKTYSECWGHLYLALFWSMRNFYSFYPVRHTYVSFPNALKPILLKICLKFTFERFVVSRGRSE